MFLGDILNISGIFTIKEMYHEKYYQQGENVFSNSSSSFIDYYMLSK